MNESIFQKEAKRLFRNFEICGDGDRAMALNLRDGDARLYRGLICLRICLRKNQFAEATALLQKAIALNPGAEGYHFALGVVLMQGNREAAKSEFRQELKYHPTNGLAKMQIDRMEKAPSTVLR